MSAYSKDVKIRFEDCDPAGIVFYPRFFEMLNELVEDWFEDALNLPWRELVMERQRGVPTVKVITEFLAPSRLGDVLTFHLDLVHLGKSSCELKVDARAGGELRIKFSVTLVHFSTVTLKSVPWPTELRRRMEQYLLADIEMNGERSHG
jgi:4-hydroxybenzoyl-CoA thioesterase